MAVKSDAAREAGLINRPSLILKRRIHAPAEKVYQAWTDPQKIVRWFAPVRVKAGTQRASIDARVGGRYRLSFDTEDGEHHEVGGVYREMVPNERLVFSWAWHSTPERESLVKVLLQPEGEGTLLALHHEQLFDQVARERHERGWTGMLDNLEQHLA
jgi:uncharacterized protein YndB with AHSA1/START domain